jgi:prephenate dehydratase
MELRELRIAIQGIPASFHHEMARAWFGKEAEVISCKTFRESCRMLVSNQADYVVMAAGNSIAGNILSNYELLMEYQLCIVAEAYKKISLHLMALPGTSLESIRTVTSHPMALLQCSEFISALSRVEVLEGRDTAWCAKEIAEKQLQDTGAIAGCDAAEQYGLHLVQKNIHSHLHNHTRFWMLSKCSVYSEQANKASLSFCLKDKKGALASLLAQVRASDLNLTDIQSLPLPGRAGYFRFYADLEFSDAERYEHCLKSLRVHCEQLQVLGKYLKQEIPV